MDIQLPTSRSYQVGKKATAFADSVTSQCWLLRLLLLDQNFMDWF
jgi:hypothetical protein